MDQVLLATLDVTESIERVGQALDIVLGSHDLGEMVRDSVTNEAILALAALAKFRAMEPLVEGMMHMDCLARILMDNCRGVGVEGFGDSSCGDDRIHTRL